MALSLMHIGGKVALGYDSATGERGFLTRIVNGTGGVSVKGTCVSNDSADDSKFIACPTGFDIIGVVAEDGIADDAECWVWKAGSRAQVLWKDSTSATRGYVALGDDVDGRAYDVAVPSANPVVAEHFREIGHVCESKIAGTNVLVLVDLHFN